MVFTSNTGRKTKSSNCFPAAGRSTGDQWYRCFKGWERSETVSICRPLYCLRVKKPRQFLHILMPLAGIVDLDKNGKPPRVDGTASSSAPCPVRWKPKRWSAAASGKMNMSKKTASGSLKSFSEWHFLQSLNEGWVKNPFLGHPWKLLHPAPIIISSIIPPASSSPTTTKILSPASNYVIRVAWPSLASARYLYQFILLYFQSVRWKLVPHLIWDRDPALFPELTNSQFIAVNYTLSYWPSVLLLPSNICEVSRPIFPFPLSQFCFPSSLRGTKQSQGGRRHPLSDSDVPACGHYLFFIHNSQLITETQNFKLTAENFSPTYSCRVGAAHQV